MCLINKIKNNNITLQYIIIKVDALSTLEITDNVKNNINTDHKSIKLSFTTTDGEFSFCLVNNIQKLIKSYQFHFIKQNLGESNY